MKKLLLCSIIFIVVLIVCINPNGLLKLFSDKSQEPSEEVQKSLESIALNDSSNDSIVVKEGNMILVETFTNFSSPTGIAIDDVGNLYVSNWSGGTVTKIDINGEYSVYADNIKAPAGLAFDLNGNLYIADYSGDVIYIVSKDGIKRIFAEGLHTPTGISFNQKGELLVANRGSDEIVKIDSTGKSILVAAGMQTPVGVVEDTNGDLYVTNYGGVIIKVMPNGSTETFSKDFGRPGVGIDISSQNTLFATDNGDGCVRAINADGTTETIINNIGGCVALLCEGNNVYVGSWNDGAVYVYENQ